MIAQPIWHLEFYIKYAIVAQKIMCLLSVSKNLEFSQKHRILFDRYLSEITELSCHENPSNIGIKL